MNTTHNTHELDAPTLTTLALGEIHTPEEAQSLHDAIAAAPALRQEYDSIVSLAENLRQEYQAELARQPSLHRSKSTRQRSSHSNTHAQYNHRRHGQSSHHNAGRMNTVPYRAHIQPSITEKIIRFAVFGGAGLSAATLLFFMLRTEDKPRQWQAPTTELPPQNQTARAGEFAIRLPDQQRERKTAHANATLSHSALANAAPHQGDTLANLVAQMPAHTPGNGENAFISTTIRHSAPLFIRKTGGNYAQRLQETMTKGRTPEHKLVRIDGLVNSLLANALASRLSQPTTQNIRIETDVVRAPWAKDRWVVRTSILTGNASGDPIVGRNARANFLFQADKVASWRILGHEDAPAQATSLDTPVKLVAGEMFTTLIEITPVGTSLQAENIGEISIQFETQDALTISMSKRVTAPANNNSMHISDDTRLALAAASLALTLRHSPHRGTADLTLTRQLTSQVRNPNGRRLLEAMLRSAGKDA
ncbi:MAG: hypothetical protein LBD01_00255 [Puniceicoccales bacterium]|jgi:hypothetical protein|nr:hypothetical protein [Puniceicoccales bacterium]